MIWRLVISFNILLTLGCPSLASGSTVTGSIRLVKSSDAAVKHKDDFSGVVVWLGPTGEGTPVLTKRHAQMLQKDKKFTPHILAIQIGTSVDFPNEDPIFHNAFSNFNGQLFDIGLYPPGSSRAIRFTKPGIVRVFCNIHPSMAATIVVVDSPYFAVSDRLGNYKIPDVAAGSYEMHFFHERATPEVLRKLTQMLTVTDMPSPPIATTISESGYLPVAHKNKYRRDYDKAAESDAYPGPVR